MIVTLAFACHRDPPGHPPPDTIDHDHDGFPAFADCDDADPTRHPDATDIPGDLVDQDCSGSDAQSAVDLDAEASATWDGPISFAVGGRRIAAEDLNGDGRAELAVAGPGPTDCGPEPYPSAGHGCATDAQLGHIWFLAWNGSWTEQTLQGSAWGAEALQEFIDLAGDLNGDGSPDLVTGSYNHAHVLFGPGPWTTTSGDGVTSHGPTLLKSSVPDDDGDGRDSVLIAGSDDTLYVWRDLADFAYGPTSLELGGTSPATSGIAGRHPVFVDLDADGSVEWLFGASDHAEADGDEGAVYVVPAGLSGEMALTDVASAWIGATPRAEVGFDLAAVGDFDGDGADDAIAGAPLDDHAAERAGRVYLLAGLPSPSGTPVDTASLIVEGELAFAWLGWRVTGPVDANGDGAADLVIGAPGDVYDGGLPGEVHLLLGPRTGVVSAADADRTWVGDEVGSSTGAGLAVGDLDADGFTDLAIGAPTHSTGAGAEAGRVYLLLGPLAP